jgi:transposase
MDFHLNSLLNLPNTTIFTCYKEIGFTVIHLQLINEGINCPHCQKYTGTIHQVSHILVRDLSIIGSGVYLKTPRRKFYCNNWKKYPTEQLTWVENKQRFTRRYQEFIYERVKESSCEQVSRVKALSAEQVQRIFSRIANRELETKDWGAPQRLSLDEFSRRKGKGRFATVVTDLDKSSLVEVIDSHKSEDIIMILMQQPQHIRDSVKEVCVDMWGGFPKIIREVFPNAVTTIDRFHVMKLVNKSLNKLRLNLDFKGLENRYLLLSNNQSLLPEEINNLSVRLNQSPVMSIAYELKEELRHIYESDLTVKGGLRAIKKWLISAKIIFGTAANTIENHLLEIANYFLNRTTSGVTEGINTRIKLILRQSYGFKNFNLMRQKLLACLLK